MPSGWENKSLNDVAQKTGQAEPGSIDHTAGSAELVRRQMVLGYAAAVIAALGVFVGAAGVAVALLHWLWPL